MQSSNSVVHRIHKSQNQHKMYFKMNFYYVHFETLWAFWFNLNLVKSHSKFIRFCVISIYNISFFFFFKPNVYTQCVFLCLDIFGLVWLCCCFFFSSFGTYGKVFVIITGLLLWLNGCNQLPRLLFILYQRIYRFKLLNNLLKFVIMLMITRLCGWWIYKKKFNTIGVHIY